MAKCGTNFSPVRPFLMVAGILSCCLFSPKAAVEPVSFSLWATNVAIISTPSASFPPTFLIGDFNSDGRMDLLLHDSGQPPFGYKTILLSNRADGTFSSKTLPHGQIQDYAGVDWNRDSTLDLIHAGNIESGISFGTNSTMADLLKLGLYTGGHPLWLDFDGDGDQDALIAGSVFGPAVLAIWEQSSPVSFQNLNRQRLMPNADRIIKADFNADGRVDWLLLTRGRTNLLQLGLNTGSARWDQVEVPLPQEAYVQDGLAADFDNDGLPDLLLRELSEDNLLLLHNQDGTHFIPWNLGLPAIRVKSLAAGDLNNDGFPDVMLTPNFFQPGDYAIYLNDHGTNFIGSGYNPSAYDLITPADFNGDKSLDLLVHEYGRFLIYTNSAPTTKTPGVPRNLTASSKSIQDAVFSWSPPEGGTGFTYNIRIGTTPDGIDIVSPNSDLKTGTRRIVEPGNAGSGGVYPIGPLPPGTYYWSVQSINQAFAGSEFTDEQIFEQTTAPLFRAVAATNVTLTSAMIEAQINPGGLPADYYIEYGIDPQHLRQTATSHLEKSTDYLDVKENLSDLAERISHMYRVVAWNSNGTNFFTAAFETHQFAEKAFQSSITNSGAIFLPGDIDGDGVMDIVIKDASTSGAAVFRNSGTGFDLLTTLWTNILGCSYVDWNNDGKLDLAGLQGLNLDPQHEQIRFRLALNDGTGSFNEISTNLPDDWTIAAVDLHDIDNDGVVDLLVRGGPPGNYDLYLFSGLGNGAFRSKPIKLLEKIDSPAYGDFDNDGYIDILAGSFVPGYGRFRFLRNVDGEGFNVVQEFERNWGVVSQSVDANQDGYLDVSLNGPINSPINWLLINHSGTHFEHVEIISRRILTLGASWADFDFDGLPDLLVPGYNLETVPIAPALSLYKSTKDQLVEVPMEVPTGRRQILAGGWMDIDADGDLDILLARGTDGFQALINNIDIPPLPLSPENITSAVTRSGVRLSWSPPQGVKDHTLTFNVRVGTAPGKWDIINPLTIPGSGKLLIPQMGNANLRQFSILTNLPAGDYYWSAQSVDWAYGGSDFAPEQKFTIQPDTSPLSLQLLQEPDLQISVSGQRGRKFVIESSVDLRNWVPSSTNSLLWHKAAFPISITENLLFFRIRNEP